MKVRGIEVEFAPAVLFHLLTETGMDESDVRWQFKTGFFCNVYTTTTGIPSTKYAVLWNNDRKRLYLFTCVQEKQGSPWFVRSVAETCPGHHTSFVCVSERHLVTAQEAFHKYLNRKKSHLADKTRRMYSIVVCALKKEEGRVTFAKNFLVGSARMMDVDAFSGGGLEFLNLFVPKEKLDQVEVPADCDLSVQVMLRGKATVVRALSL